MSRSKYRPKNWFDGVKRDVKSGSRTFSRADARKKIDIIMKDIDSYDDILFYRYQDYDDTWNYD